MSFNWLRQLRSHVKASRRHIRTARPPRARFCLEVLEDRTVPAIITVNTLADTVAADSFMSLREAITAANNYDGADTIEFSVAGSIYLSSALPDLSTNINIQGPGANFLAVQRSSAQGTPYFRIFTVNSGATVAISGLTMANGYILGGTYGNGNGGGIYNNGALTVSNSTLSSNSAYWHGGGIHNQGGTLTVSNSTLSGNNAVGYSARPARINR